jgi:hypothetical protein
MSDKRTQSSRRSSSNYRTIFTPLLNRRLSDHNQWQMIDTDGHRAERRVATRHQTGAQTNEPIKPMAYVRHFTVSVSLKRSRLCGCCDVRARSTNELD